MCPRLAVFWLALWLNLRFVGSEDVGLSESIVIDDECDALGEDSRCAVNALQHQARRKKVDLDSIEGAELIEATRAWYGSHTREEVDGGSGDNGTVKLLGPRNGIDPPKTAVEHNGISWPALNIPREEAHFFAIGDWGGMDGELQPPDGYPRMITYAGGHLHGPHVFPRSRMSCSHEALNDCYSGGLKSCSSMCGFAPGVDDRAQLLVAEQMRKRAADHDPQFILNVGDNFYWGGIAKKCGFPMNQIHPATAHQFHSIFEEVYTGPGIDGKPWFSVLGNHDWGGRQFTAGWDQQIAYTWFSARWLMPAVYWHQRVNFQDFAADIFMLDSNFMDAKAPNKDTMTNICGAEFNGKGSSCASTGGPGSVAGCQGWFRSLWKKEQTWLENHLTNSTADWQIVVTHFPCNKNTRYWKNLHYKFGLDLLVTGHRHVQQLWKANSPDLGGLTCMVTGGGGGISSEESPLAWKPSHGWQHVNAQYGFFDMTISKRRIKVESIDYRGELVGTTVVHPKNPK